jgi:hypothetical protein
MNETHTQKPAQKAVKTKIQTLFIVLLLALPAAVQAQVNYFVLGDGAWAYGGDPYYSGNIVIASTYDGYPVTGITSRGFASAYVTSVTIPDSVTNIGEEAFEDCISLTSVTIGTNVTFIGDAAFADTALTSVTIPDSLTSIGGGVFEDCTSLTNVTIPSSVASIGDEAFFLCRSLNVTIPDSVTSIGDEAFGVCTSLTSVTIPDSVTSIGYASFYDCYSLTNIAVAVDNPAYSSVNGVLFDKMQATLIQFPGGVGGSYTIPNSVTSIGDEAFRVCPLKSVTIPDSVTSIGDSAFSDCYNLKSAYFQGNAPPDDGFAFYDYPYNGTTIVYYLPGTTGWGPTFGDALTAFWTLPHPLVLDNNPNFGVRNNQFGFTVSWATNRSIVVQACTNLASPVWSPIATNALASGTNYFSDPQWTNYPSRFYRISSP